MYKFGGFFSNSNLPPAVSNNKIVLLLLREEVSYSDDTL